MVSEGPVVLFPGAKRMHTEGGPLGPVFSEQTQKGSLEEVKKKRVILMKRQNVMRSVRVRFIILAVGLLFMISGCA
ncbi:MAG: hypothetical protein AMK74_00020 [Nitrospira bacterium SM23_35]|nr:MAG: hypothetical protein AMK74_00020 [Nitrospira bacterium SM23_35]